MIDARRERYVDTSRSSFRKESLCRATVMQQKERHACKGTREYQMEGEGARTHRRLNRDTESAKQLIMRESL